MKIGMEDPHDVNAWLKYPFLDLDTNLINYAWFLSIMQNIKILGKSGPNTMIFDIKTTDRVAY